MGLSATPLQNHFHPQGRIRVICPHLVDEAPWPNASCCLWKERRISYMHVRLVWVCLAPPYFAHPTPRTVPHQRSASAWKMDKGEAACDEDVVTPPPREDGWMENGGNEDDVIAGGMAPLLESYGKLTCSA